VANDEAARALQAAERELTARLLNVWRVPPGRFPWLTLLVVLAAIAITTLAHIHPQPTYRILYSTPTELWTRWKWWGLLGAVFIHGGLLHLLFNCYWTWILGRLIERELGSGRYALLLLAGAWVGSAAELGVSGRVGVGLSGVVYALFGLMFVNRSHHADFARVLPRNTLYLLFGWLIACFPLTYAGVFNVANFAHVGGLVIGCVLGWAAYRNAGQKPAQFAAVAIGVVSFVPLLWSPQHEQWLVAKAYRALLDRDEDRALALLDRIRAKNPAHAWALRTEASLRWKRGDYALARDRLARLVEHSEDAGLLNRLAWLLATCPAAEIRDGARAVALARRACESDGWKSAAYLDTLAAAYAEAGNFEEAEKWALKAAENPGEHATTIQAHLKSFRAGKPWREPLPGSDRAAHSPR